MNAITFLWRTINFFMKYNKKCCKMNANFGFRGISFLIKRANLKIWQLLDNHETLHEQTADFNGENLLFKIWWKFNGNNSSAKIESITNGTTWVCKTLYNFLSSHNLLIIINVSLKKPFFEPNFKYFTPLDYKQIPSWPFQIM